MRKHCRQKHDWKQYQVGRPSKSQRARVAEQGQGAWSTGVSCQRLFAQGPHSGYFEVNLPPKRQRIRGTEPEQEDMKQRWQDFWEVGSKDVEGIREGMKRRIEDGEKDEVNLWLERTGWLRFLKGYDRLELVQSIQQPDKDDETEEKEHTIWVAMGRLVRMGQHLVKNKAGIFVRMEVIRSEKTQTRFTPLMAYQDEEGISVNARPWQQVVMFFLRTKRTHEWESPKYKFTRVQKKCWGKMMLEAESEVQANKSKGSNIRRNKSKSKDTWSSREEGIDEVQEAREEAAVEAQEESLTALQLACLEFCISLLDQRGSGSEYDCALVKAIAILGVDMNGWKGVDVYPPILSRLIKVARFMVIQRAYHHTQLRDEEQVMADRGNHEGNDYEESNEDSSDIDEEGEGKGRVVDFVKEMVDRFMVRGTNTPMQWMLDLRAYGLKMQYNTTSEGQVDWRGGEELVYKALHFNMDAFRGFVHMLVGEARKQLEEELLRGFKAPDLSWDTLYDDPSNNTHGWNFLQDERNILEDGKRWMFQQIKDDEEALKDFINPATGAIRGEEVGRYMHGVSRFRALLLILMHITGGQPARGPEILSVRHSNTTKGQHRNLFVEDGLVCFVTVYHKNVVSTDKSKVIHRYLPREVGELLVKYLWLVLPFQVLLESHKEGFGRKSRELSDKGISDHLWPTEEDGRRWTPARMTRILRQETAKGLGQRIGLQEYRQIAIAMGRRYLKGNLEHDDDDDEDEEWDEDNFDRRLAGVMDKQAAHGTHIAGMVYARLIREMSGSIAEVRKGYKAASIMWHAFLRFGSVIDEEKRDGGVRSRKRKRFEGEEAPVNWHDGMEKAQVLRWKLAKSLDLEVELKRVFGENATYRGQQKEALQAIMNGEARVVAVLATGEGKSLLFMLPALCVRGGLTILVLPLIALRQDMMKRCKSFGLRCVEWTAGATADDAGLVMVTPESAGSGGFHTFLNRVSRKIDRIVIDECHVVLNDGYNFRRKMQQLGDLTRARVQMVLLTATLPVSKREELWKRMHWNERENNVRIFHKSTTRKNISYQVATLKPKGKLDKESLVLRLINKGHKECQPGKVLVYCNTIKEVQIYSNALGVDGYHSRAEMRGEKLEGFMRKEDGLIVATSALGMGLDIPDIRVVIHIGRPRSLEEYLQESGRAGRDGLKSKALVILWWGEEGEQAQGEVQEGIEGAPTQRYGFRRATDDDLVEQFLQVRGGVEKVGTRVCRRQVIDEYMDGVVARSMCKEEEEKCDICKDDQEEVWEEAPEEQGARDEGVKVLNNTGEAVELRISEEDKASWKRLQVLRGQGGENLMQRNKEDGEKWVELERNLRLWQGKCGFCYVRGKGRLDPRHALWECPVEQSRAAREAFYQVKGGIFFESFCACFQCGAPQGMCQRWEEKRSGGYKRAGGSEVQCSYPDGVIAGFIGMLYGGGQPWLEGFRGKLERVEGLGWGRGDEVDFRKGSKLMRWFGRRLDWNGESVSVLAEEMMKMGQRVERAIQKIR